MDGYRASRDEEGRTIYDIPANMTYSEWKKAFVDGESLLRLSSRGDKKFFISDKIINNVKGIRYYGMDKAKSEKLNNIHVELLKYSK